MSFRFDDLELAPELLQALGECGYQTPTPIQQKAIPTLLEGRDLMGCAQTGTGKTAAFALPILQALRGEVPGVLRALVLVPTRELAIQVGRSIREYAQYLDLRSTAVYGGAPSPPQEMMLRHGVDILVATPGRLKDHMWKGLIDFKECRFLVLDEADRMLDMGFIDDVREIVSMIPRNRQTMLFSATLDPQVVRLARDILRDPLRVEVARSATPAEGIDHFVLRVESGEKRSRLESILRDPAIDRTLVFTRTKRGAHVLSQQLKRAGHRVSSLHADKSQSQRLAALNAFREGRVQLLVATDIAARGLDVTGISHVINYDMPRNPEDYIHRIGRTARAGRKGVAISLVTSEDGGSLRAIERMLGKPLRDGQEAVTARQGRRNGKNRGNGDGAGVASAARVKMPAATRSSSGRSRPRGDARPAAGTHHDGSVRTGRARAARRGRDRVPERVTVAAATTDRPGASVPRQPASGRGWLRRVVDRLGL